MRFEVIYKEETVSTNADLKELAKNGAPIGTAVVAERQSGGRGRLGRSFSSERGGLYMSLLLPLDDTESVGLMTTFAAVATARAIERLADVDVKIKWVNDLLVGSKKICGILAEGVMRPEGNCAVLGIGVNLTGKLSDELKEIAATVFDACGQALEPKALADEIFAEFSDFSAHKCGAHLDEYRHRCITLGKNITVIPHSAPTYSAKALKITESGGLLVKRDDNGEETELCSGEVSVRPTEEI